MNPACAGLRLVVADDSPEMRGLVRDAFADFSFLVEEAADGRELFWTLERCCRASEPRDVIVIADVCMPVYSGLDVLEARGGVRWPFPFIIMTSYPDDETRARVKRSGALLLPKPFTILDLRAALGSVRARRQS
jgi:DNA-binding response OmpR family regulator